MPHQRNLLVVCVCPQSPDEYIRFAGDLAVQQRSRVVLLHVREVPETLPIAAMQLTDADTAFLRRLRADLAARGLAVDVEVVDTRHAGRAVIERTSALRARAVLMAQDGSHRGRLGSRAAYALRHLKGPRLVLFAG